jgi:hypothetical protein
MIDSLMRLETILRRGWWRRSVRSGVAWYALLAVALPGFASMRGLCCEPGMTKASGCCASAMKMPGMDSSEMKLMDGGAAVAADRWVAATATRCAPVSESEVPEFLIRSQGAFDGSVLLTQDLHSAVARDRDASTFSSVTSDLLLVEAAPPEIFFSRPSSTVLRI